MTIKLKQDTTLDIHTRKERFQRINRARLERMKKYLSTKQVEFIDLLPYLFHINHPDLPGYISDMTPSGVSDYTPTQSTLKCIERLFKSFKPGRRAPYKREIYSLFFMGSCGTIAYTRKSDFDVWLIHSPELSPEQIDELTQKALAIEQWATEFRLEVHFFVFQAEDFKQGSTQSLSTESSGSTQHFLLLDEFYRSSLLVAGRIPIWWLVPQDKEQQFDNYVESLMEKQDISEFDFIDFGGMANIPASEFFGAAVWQLYKSINSPYKSVIKLLLMEVYASEYPDIQLLSQIYKRTMYAGSKDLVELDPYIMMYNKIEEYLMVHNEKERLDLFRQCFYFKVNERLSKRIRAKNINWKREVLENIVSNWGWDQKTLELMDSHNNWRADNVTKERQRLIRALTESYHFLSEFGRKNTEVSRVNQTELNVLGRKLYAAFERKANKIDIINRGISPSLHEPELSFFQVRNQSGNESWLLFRGHARPDQIMENKPLKRAGSIFEMLTWCHFNQIVDSHSAMSLQTCEHSLTVKELKDILNALQLLFPDGKIEEPQFKDLSQPARINIAGLFINIGVSPLPEKSSIAGHLSSNRNNALSYSGYRKNLARTFDLVICTSWEEILIYHYNGIDGLMQCICEYLRWFPVGSGMGPPRISAFSFSSSYGNSISQRIEDLFSDIIDAYYGHTNTLPTRYILEIEDTYHITEKREDGLRHIWANSDNDLLRYLSLPVTGFSPVVFDQKTNWNIVLPQLYKLNKPSTIQLFFLVDKDFAHIYILDERGSLFFQKIPYYDSISLISHFSLFFSSTINRKHYLIHGGYPSVDDMSIEFYAIEPDRQRRFGIKTIDKVPNVNPGSFFNIQVIGSLDEDDQTLLSIYCEDSEFSSLEYGKELFNAVADHVLKQRANGNTYPIYITDIDLSRSFLDKVEPDNLQTIHYLKYKKRIEEKLNAAISCK